MHYMYTAAVSHQYSAYLMLVIQLLHKGVVLIKEYLYYRICWRVASVGLEFN